MAAPTPRAALQRQAPAPIALEDKAACHGHIRINKQPLGLCVNCGRYANGTPPTMEPAAKIGALGWDCPNRRSLGALIDAETADATDDMAGLHGAATVPGIQTTQVSPESQSVVADSTRAGEGA